MAVLSLSQAQLVGKISKPTSQLSGKRFSDCVPATGKTHSWLSAKRKRDDDDTGEKSDAIPFPHPSFKKPKLRRPYLNRPILSAKPGSSCEIPYSLNNITQTESARSTPKVSLVLHNLSQPVRLLITLHQFFLRALSIHYAHNGPQAPAELDRLLDTITKLWKERLVTQADIEKLLAVYEMKTNAPAQNAAEIPHSLGPFKLAKAGSTISIEYAGERKTLEGPMSYLFDDRGVHDSYRAHIYALHSAWTKERPNHLSFFEEDSLENFAKLACEMGTQTAARNTQVARQRAEILTLSNAAQLRNTPTTASSPVSKNDDISSAIAIVESRKQKLLDRIKAKQLVRKLNAKPTHQQILRKHASGRIEEVTDILRMMQQQQKGESKSKTHDKKGWEIKSAGRASRVSFSLTQLRNNIKSSSRVPISDEEVTMCLKILSEELDGAWVKMIEGRGGSGAVFVVVEGEGISGREVQSRLMAQGS